MASLTLRIPDRLDAELDEASRQRGLSKSDVAMEALEQHLARESLRRLRERLGPHLEAQGMFTEEEVLERLGEEP